MYGGLLCEVQGLGEVNGRFLVGELCTGVWLPREERRIAHAATAMTRARGRRPDVYCCILSHVKYCQKMKKYTSAVRSTDAP